MSKIQVNEIVNHFDNGAPDCPKGLTVTGVSTFSGNVSIGGTLTYEDVTNIDSIGIITAQSGINVGPTSGIGITLTSAGNITVAGNVESSYLRVVASPLQSTGGLVRIDGSTDRAIELNYDGSATFAGEVRAGSNDNDETHSFLAATGWVNVKRMDDPVVPSRYLFAGANKDGTVVQIFADGSATFAGAVTTPMVKSNTDTIGTYTANTTVQSSTYSRGSYLLTYSSYGVYHCNGIVAITHYDTADFAVNIIAEGSYQGNDNPTFTLTTVSGVSGTFKVNFSFPRDIAGLTFNFLKLG